MNKIEPPPNNTFLQAFTANVERWARFTCAFAGLSGGLFLCSLIFLVLGKDAYAAISVTLAFICFFVLYSLSYTIKELVLVKALQCKQTVEPLYDLEKEEQVYSCIEEYYMLATWARKRAFLYESDTTNNISSVKMRLERFVSWREYHMLEEVCLLAAIDLYIRRLKITPCDVTLHARLANAYILLQNHYLEPIKAKELMLWPSIFFTKEKKEELEKKAQHAAKLALEELEIMSEDAPEEIWVHEQLAISFRELHMQEKEMLEYEKLYELTPDDPQVLLRLGTLYFISGKNGKALKMFGLLKEMNHPFAQELIAHYGAFAPFLT